MQLRFSDFKPVFRARTQLGMPPIDAANICSLQLMLSKFEADGALNPTFKEGPFELPVQQISGGRADGRAGRRRAGLLPGLAGLLLLVPVCAYASCGNGTCACRYRLGQTLSPAAPAPAAPRSWSALQPTWRSR